MEPSGGTEGTTYCFGECRFIPHRQLLLHREIPVRVGSRALDLLHALVRRPGDVVSKDELIRSAWPNVFVHEGNLKVNIAALRRALPRQPELTYIATVPGRGYRFVAPLRILGPSAGTRLSDAVKGSTGELPAIPMLIGREEVSAEIIGTLAETRLLTIVGPAGVGKTSIAIAAARQAGERLKNGVCFVDLSAIEDPQLVMPAIALGVGLETNLPNVLAGLVAMLRDREVLLILDNCEHVLNVVATVADHLNHALPGLLIVATSREPLRCRRESIYRLTPLPCPSEGSEADTAAAMSFPAVELLVRRAEVHGYRLSEADLPSLAAISRRLDGIALAIELAAPRMSTHGPTALLDLLEHGFESLASQAHATTPRHMTLGATLDWSYRLLPEPEARLLRHLSVFGGKFGLEDVVGVCGALAAAEDLATWLENLAARSLLSVTYHAGRRSYRLLDSTRSFSGERLRAHQEQQMATAAFARYLLALFEQSEIEWNWRTREDWTARYGHWGHDLRRAIDWSFGVGASEELGVRLTAAGITLWHELSSVVECRTRVGTALEAAERLPTCDRMLRLKLVAARAMNLCLSAKLGTPVDASLEEGIQLASELESAEYRLRMTMLLAGTRFFSGRYAESLATLAGLRTMISPVSEHSAAPDILRLELMNRFCRGEIGSVHTGVTRLACEHRIFANRSRTSRFTLDRFVAIRTQLAVTAWVAGHHRQAMGAAGQGVEAARTLDHTVSHAYILALAAIPVSIWCGFPDVAQEYVTALSDELTLRHIDTWPPFARFFQAAMDAKRGDPDGLEGMRAAIDELIECNLLVHLPIRLAMFAEAALPHDRLDLARTSIAKALDCADQRGERWCNAELQRVLGLVRRKEGDARGAERAFEEAVQIAQQNGALSFGLRAATNLAELWLQTDRRYGTMEPLAGIYKRFDRSFESADLVAARRIAAAL